MSSAHRSVARRGARLLAVALLGLCGASVASAPGAAAITVPPTGSVNVIYRGNGHGHGMSQYGAQGAALLGRTYQQIVAFYYPGTTFVKLPSRIIRVRLSGTGSTTTIAARSNTVVTGVTGYLWVSGYSRYRLVANSGTGLALQALASQSGAQWRTVRTNLPNRAEFYRYGGVPTRVYRTDGTSTDYDGYVRAVRVGASGTTGGVYTVNRVNDDNYTSGVVPRESPAYWKPAALAAQAVAARTYGTYSAVHAAAGSEYDICDTSSCQVYGGRAHFSSSGTTLWTNLDSAAAATSHQVLEYHGAVIFPQFSASNGGWTVYGGQPYLAAKADPYDTAASGDPYLDVTKRVSVASIAAAFGLKTVNEIIVSTRDGHGEWGGRVLTGSVRGTDGAGHAATVAATGSDFQSAFGIGTTWFACSTAT